MMLLLIITVLLAAYAILIFYYWWAWNRIPVYTSTGSTPGMRISVIIAARNEEQNIGAVLNALLKQDYPSTLVEIIVIDDHSTDTTAQVVEKFASVRLISLKEDGINSYKKKAIETGIRYATGDLVVTTDADCIPPPNWLKTIACFKKEKEAVLVAAPVLLTGSSSIVEFFQVMDFMILQGITGASIDRHLHSMGNGANLAYEKKAFEKVNGFQNIDHVASGDDMLLMYKISKAFPRQTKYLKSPDAIVSTPAMKTWRSFFNQRIRWASKAKHYEDKKLFIVLLLVYLLNLSFPVLLFAAIINISFSWYALYFLIVKTIIELPFMISVARFFKRNSLLPYFFFFQPIHIIYTIASGFFGLFGKYEWKGRKVR